MQTSLYDYCMEQNDSVLLAQWHPAKNKPLTPRQVSYGSTQKVWWQCAKGHIWQAAVNARTANHTDCPYCAGRLPWPGETDLASQYPELVNEWHPAKNLPLTPEQVLPGSEKEVWWRCAKGHTWCVSVQSRTLDGTGCPVCAGRVIVPGENDMASQFPELAREWHPEKNGPLRPSQVAPSSRRRVWWLCPLGHTYAATVEARTGKGSGCPYCAGKKVLAGFNDLETTQPLIAAQWPPALNGALTPQMVTAGSHKRAWWVCPEGHVWKAVIYSRAGPQKRGCPVCAGKVRPEQQERYRRILTEVE